MTATTRRRAVPADRRAGSRLMEVLAVLLLGVATVGSAWCGYQASRWNGEENDLARDSGEVRVEASRLFGLGVQTLSYDTNLVAQYAPIVRSGDEQLQQFFRDSLFREEFLPILDEWEAQASAGQSPVRLLDDPEYMDSLFADYSAAEDAATALTVESDEAGSNADDYVLTTLLLASALFFAGVTTSFRVWFARLVLLAGAGVLIAYAAARLVDLPVA